jgi:beta-aspartyl-peptidase (threonine type)
MSAIMVHGGLKTLAPGATAAFKEGCLSALAVGWAILRDQGGALDACEAAVRALEANPIFNAGVGSSLNADGDVEMDAAIMEGGTLRAGAVAALRGVAHPISIARRVMESGAVLLAGEGARRFAEEHSEELCEAGSLITEEARRDWESVAEMQSAAKDTVGCVAMDAAGELAAATSTGGLSRKLPGRVGDSPLIGCGLYADGLGAVSLTGDGESIIRTALASRVIGFLHSGADPDAAAVAALRYFRDHVPGEAGCIVLDRQGRLGAAHHSANMSWACFGPGMDAPRAFTAKQ